MRASFHILSVSGDRRRPIRGRKRPAAGGEPTRTEIGDTAPDFTLPASDGRTYSLTKLRGKYVVLAWFPKAFTGG